MTDLALFDVAAVPHALSLADRFLCPPFSVLDARGGWWAQRKATWKRLPMRSEEGRDARTFARGAGTDDTSQKILAVSDGQSIFDPVLCELAYRWFCPPAGRVLDPFAGGSVRGVVATWCDRHYHGIDLSATQIAANREQYLACTDDPTATGTAVWHVGDSRSLLNEWAAQRTEPFDLVFSCPPYHNLEVYSDDPNDLSNMPWDSFVAAHRDIIRRSVDLLAEDRFAVWVVGEIRGPNGAYRNLVGTTIEAFEAAGLQYHNECVVLNPLGTHAIRAARGFVATRKICKCHQNVLVFAKGDPKRAATVCGAAPIADLGDVESVDV